VRVGSDTSTRAVDVMYVDPGAGSDAAADSSPRPRSDAASASNGKDGPARRLHTRTIRHRLPGRRVRIVTSYRTARASVTTSTVRAPPFRSADAAAAAVAPLV
jgi:hypothetical protein